jgi:HK97 family phage major capsid protein
MVQSKVDSELLNGVTGATRITGLLQTTGIQTHNASTNPSPVDAIEFALTKVRTIGYFEPDHIILHPNDWRDFKLTKDSNGQYLAGGPFSGTYGVGGYNMPDNMWGKPVVWTTAIAEGTALVGAFRLGAQVWNKMGLRLDSTNSDGDDFKYNRICLRAERRLTLSCYRPLAFCTVTNIG